MAPRVNIIEPEANFNSPIKAYVVIDQSSEKLKLSAA